MLCNYILIFPQQGIDVITYFIDLTFTINFIYEIFILSLIYVCVSFNMTMDVGINKGRKSLGHPGTAVTGRCELPNMGARKESSVF